jgi:hypothetical protein
VRGKPNGKNHPTPMILRGVNTPITHYQIN